MKSLKRSLLVSLLCMQIAFGPAIAQAGEVDAALSRRQNAIDLLDAFIKARNQEKLPQYPDFVMRYIEQHEAQQPKDPLFDNADVFSGVGASEALASDVSVQVLGLEPGDFNLFMLDFLQRYVSLPNNRADLFEFMQMLRSLIATDLANTVEIEKGPVDAALKGSYQTGTWIFLGMLGIGMAQAFFTRGRSVVQNLEQAAERLTMKQRALRFAGGMAKSPFLWSLAAGGSIGYMTNYFEQNKTHRFDPAEIIKIIQGELSCSLSYRGLELEQRTLDLSTNEARKKEDVAALAKDINILINESSELLKEFPLAEKLITSDRLWQLTNNKYPKSENWTDFRLSIANGEANPDGQCREMNLSRMNVLLMKDLVVLGGL